MVVPSPVPPKAARGGSISLRKRRKDVSILSGSDPDACVLDAQVQRALADSPPLGAHGHAR